MKAQTPDSRPGADAQARPGNAPPEGASAEWLSALADGEAVPTHAAIGAALADAAARQRWSDYHLIGEALRSPGMARQSRIPDDAFLARVRAGMASADAAGETHAIDTAPMPQAGHGVAVHRVPQPAGAANDAVFRWRMVAGVAVVTAAGVIAAALWGTSPAPESAMAAATSRAASPSPTDAVANPNLNLTPNANVAVASNMLRDPRLDAFLQAHRDAGGPSALHMPTGFLRNATFEGSAR